LQVFISYRRSDAQSAARQLAEALKSRFGPDHVFFDTHDIVAGAEWRSSTVQRVQGSDVVLAIVGPHWAAMADERAHRSARDHMDEDLVRVEIESAFKHGAMVIPVLVDDAQMPARESLPRPFRPLADVQAQTLHHTSWERDVEALAEALQHLAAQRQPLEAPPVPGGGEPEGRPDGDAGRVARYIADGSIAIVLGSGANAVDRDAPWDGDGDSLPDSTELARHLARRFGVAAATDDLAEISQHVSLTEGRVDLCRTIRDVLVKANGAPTSVHHAVARLPGRLRDLGAESYQLIVTTAYDAALERAMEELHEPFDLVLFVSTGEHRGRFLHVPWWDPHGGRPRPVTVPNEYVDLPIDEDGQLGRTVVVKLHGGAADVGPGGPRLRDNFVITEDDYIGYLTQGPIESLIPLQLLNKLRDSHFLFLGYRMRDWSLRVFLQRVWGEQQLEARSWVIDPSPDVVERSLWDHFGVRVVEEPLPEFLDELDRELGRVARTPVER
jgi:SIR2-like domain/TIR domain